MTIKNGTEINKYTISLSVYAFVYTSDTLRMKEQTS